MNYLEFKKKSSSVDDCFNDNIHYFSSRYKNFFAYIFYKIKFSANLTTFSFFFFGLISVIFCYNQSYILSWILWRLHLIVDMADGVVARATNTFSKYAKLADKSIHFILYNLIFLILNKNQINFSVFLIMILFFIHSNFKEIFHVKQNLYENSAIFSNLNKKKSIIKNFIRDLIGIEGYIFFSFFCPSDIQVMLNFIYSINFIIFIVLKKLILKKKL